MRGRSTIGSADNSDQSFSKCHEVCTYEKRHFIVNSSCLINIFNVQDEAVTITYWSNLYIKYRSSQCSRIRNRCDKR
ncbi:unnamed protein product [Colias eurytheme]|nr:unnamed protein product [Colias eurytheme]